MSGPALLTPADWERNVAKPPVLAAALDGTACATLRRWIGTPGEVVQPPLDQHYLVLHLGGPKRVSRAGGGRVLTTDVPLHSVTVVPAGRSFTWRTVGPIDYAHVYFPADRVARAVERWFERDPAGVEVVDRVGSDSPAVAGLMAALLRQAQRPRSAPLYLDLLGDALLAAVVREHTTLPVQPPPAREALPPFKRRRLAELIEARLEGPLGLDELAGEAGLSRFHFARAFSQTFGVPPHRYVTLRRVERAKALLRAGGDVHEVAQRCGFSGDASFRTVFRRVTGLTPIQYRRSRA